MFSADGYRSLCSRVTLQNKAEGCFFELVEKFSTQIDWDQFASCSTDSERIDVCATKFWKGIGVELIFRGKDALEGNRFKIEGNTAFENGNFEEALLHYSKSSIRVPPGLELASVLANRSALLYRMKKYELAIEDCKLAMSYDYPEEKRHILYDRMGSAYLHVKNYKLAQITVGLADHFASKNCAKDSKFMQKLAKVKLQIETMIITEDRSDADMRNVNLVAPHSSSSFSASFPCATSKFNVITTKTEGRFAIASEEIDIGEEILAENPYAACLLPERNGSHCHHCQKRLPVSIPCDTCAYVAFCSLKCRDEAKRYHQFECKVLLLLVGSGMSVLPLLALRIITQTSVENLLKDWEELKIDEIEILKNDAGVYAYNKYKTVYNMIAHEQSRTVPDFFQRTIMALFLVKALRLTGYFNVKIFTSPDPTYAELQIGALLLRNLQILQFNAYEIVEANLPPKTPATKFRLLPIGLGIYSTAAFLNHSCAPNVVRHFTGTTLHVTAIQKISGGLIGDNYGPIYTKVGLEDRQRVLEGRYWFTCRCIACQENWPKLTNASDLGKSRTDNDLDPDLSSILALLEVGKSVEVKPLLINYLQKSETISANLTPGLLPTRKRYIAEEALRLVVISQQAQTT